MRHVLNLLRVLFLGITIRCEYLPANCNRQKNAPSNEAQTPSVMVWAAKNKDEIDAYLSVIAPC